MVNHERCPPVEVRDSSGRVRRTPVAHDLDIGVIGGALFGVEDPPAENYLIGRVHGIRPGVRFGRKSAASPKRGFIRIEPREDSINIVLYELCATLSDESGGYTIKKMVSYLRN